MTGPSSGQQHRYADTLQGFSSMSVQCFSLNDLQQLEERDIKVGLDFRVCFPNQLFLN